MKAKTIPQYWYDVAIWKLKGSKCKMCHENKATTSTTAGKKDMCEDCVNMCFIENL